MKLKESDIFKSLKSFSPTAKPKSMSITPLNLMKFEQFLVSAKTYAEESNAAGNEHDYA